MNLLHVIASMDPAYGGPSQGIRNYNGELSKIGISRTVVSLDDPKSDFLALDKFSIIALGAGKRPWFYNSKLIPWLITNLQLYDVVIINGLWLFPSFAVWFITKYHKYFYRGEKNEELKLPKILVMPHGMLDPWFQKAEGRISKSIRNWLYWHLIENRVVNLANGLLFTCERELQLARTTFKNYKPRNEFNIGYGIPHPPENCAASKNAFFSLNFVDESEPYFLFLSRLNEKKGLDLLIKAYLSLKKEDTVIPKLVVAGPGLDTAFGKAMQRLASSDNDIIFAGMLSGDAKWGAFYGCEAFILPSHQENFGISVVEALACAKPVLISNQVNIWQEIEQSGGGIVVEDSINGTRSAIEQWSRLSPPQKREMGQRAYEAYQSLFAITSVAKKLYDVITSTAL